MQQISAPQLKAWLDDPARDKPQLIDVRQPWEFDVCRIPGAKLVGIEGMGHDLPPVPVAEMLTLMTEHWRQSAA